MCVCMCVCMCVYVCVCVCMCVYLLCAVVAVGVCEIEAGSLLLCTTLRVRFRVTVRACDIISQQVDGEGC
jgi:hypothetical protein